MGRQGASEPQTRYDGRMSDHSYRIEIKHRAKPPSPFKWEIYDGEAMVPVETSKETFKTRGAASAAGQLALDRLEERNYRAASHD
jgi:hypothetical protein